jgi:hypothetical protein
MIASVAQIESRMFLIRGEKVMLSQHLAELYEVEPRALNQAVKRNLDRFPEDFMFQLTQEEFANLKSQFVISSWGGIRTAPYAFTEQGVAMLSSVLRSERAIQGRHSGEGRNPVKKNTPRSGQNEPPAVSFEVRPILGVAPLAWNISIIWIPAFAGMTDFRPKGLFGFKAVFDAIHNLMSPPENKKKRPIGFAPWEKP